MPDLRVFFNIFIYPEALFTVVHPAIRQLGRPVCRKPWQNIYGIGPGFASLQ
jgi:hypothetical protein